MKILKDTVHKKIQRAAELLANSNFAVALTGAGYLP